ncbi:MAG: hypothetical protein ACRC20_00480 [Segniliparus sp.]|uniref:hypothetical protein n=1 Tax=Segniliparus sp. TaxID=2804064 RepID=UPI003F3D4429
MTRAALKTILRAPRLAVAALAVVVVVAAALIGLGRIAHFDDAPPPPAAAPQKSSLADKSPEELRATLMTQGDVPKYLKISAQSKSPVAAQAAKPADCSLRLFGEHDRAVAEAHAYADDFNGMFYDGRYATELLMRPKEGEGGLVDFARDWLAKCAAFTVTLSGSSEQYSAYTVSSAAIPENDSSLGLKVTYAFAKSDPFRNEVFYYTVARVRDIDVLVVSGLPGVSEDLAGRTVARLASL